MREGGAQAPRLARRPHQGALPQAAPAQADAAQACQRGPYLFKGDSFFPFLKRTRLTAGERFVEAKRSEMSQNKGIRIPPALALHWGMGRKTWGNLGESCKSCGSLSQFLVAFQIDILCKSLRERHANCLGDLEKLIGEFWGRCENVLERTLMQIAWETWQLSWGVLLDSCKILR